MRTLLFLSSATLLCGSVAAQPDKTAALEKAKGKFEMDISKAEEALIASMDKALTKAQTAGNKVVVEKLTYEREGFVNNRIVPTAVPAVAYLKQRRQATAALETVYQPVLKDLAKAKKEEEVETLEKELSELLKASRGYGLGIPYLESKPVFLIENKNSGLVLETSNNAGSGELIMGAKMGKRKPAQCWQLEREEKGYVVRNVGSGQVFHVPAGNATAGTGLVTWRADKTKETEPWSLFKITEIRRDIVISSAFNGFVLTVTETKQKGVAISYVTQEKKQEPPLATQLWTLTEAK